MMEHESLQRSQRIGRRAQLAKHHKRLPTHPIAFLRHDLQDFTIGVEQLPQANLDFIDFYLLVDIADVECLVRRQVLQRQSRWELRLPIGQPDHPGLSNLLSLPSFLRLGFLVHWLGKIYFLKLNNLQFQRLKG